MEAADGYKMIFVVDVPANPSGMDENGYLTEFIKAENVIAVEDCPDDVTPVATVGWKPQ